MPALKPAGYVLAGGMVRRAFPPGVDPAGRVPARGAWPLSAPLALAALPGAEECASLHARLVATEWGLGRLAGAAAQLAGELVGSAIAASRELPGQPVVRLWLRGDRERLLVAAWDAVPAPPAAGGWREWPFGGVAQERGWHEYEGGKTCWSVLSRREPRRGLRRGRAPGGAAVSAVSPVLPEDEGRRVAAGIEEQNAGWMIVFGALTRQFVAFPLFAAGPGTCVATVDPHALACRMRLVEATALRRDVPVPAGKGQRQAHRPERAVAPVPCPPPAAVGLAWEWLSPWCLPAAVLLPPGWAFLTPVPLAVLACRGRDGDRVPLSWQAVMAVAAGLGCGSASLLFRAVAERAGQRLTPGEPSWLAVAAACGVLQWAVTSAVVLIAARGARPPAAWVPAGRDAMRADVAGLCLGVLVAACVARCPCCVLLAIPMIAVLRRSREHPGLARAARTDAKTGLLNAAAWQQAAGTEAARAARTGRPLAVAMIDIDHFKAVNDTRGHLAGDKVLAAVAGVIAAGVRGYDVAGRFGGEEFAVLLPDTGEAGAARMGERLRVRIAGNAVGSGGGELRVTVSIGIAVSRPGCATAEELVAAADAALYAAKRDGRDRVRLAELPSETDAGSCLEGASVHDHG